MEQSKFISYENNCKGRCFEKEKSSFGKHPHAGDHSQVLSYKKFNRHYISRVNVFYDQFEKQKRILKKQVDQLASQINSFRKRFETEMFEKFCNSLEKNGDGKKISDVVKVLVGSEDEEEDSCEEIETTCSEMAHFIANFKGEEHFNFKEEIKKVKREFEEKLCKIINPQAQIHKSMNFSNISSINVMDPVNQVLQDIDFDKSFEKPRKKSQKSQRSQKIEDVMEVIEKMNKIDGKENKVDSIDESVLSIEIEDSEDSEEEDRQMEKKQQKLQTTGASKKQLSFSSVEISMSKKSSRETTMIDFQDEEEQEIKVKNLQTKYRKNKQKFSIKIKVIKFLMYRIFYDRRSKTNFRKVKIIGGDQTGIIICYLNLYDWIKVGNTIIIKNCHLTNFFDRSYEIEGHESSLVESKRDKIAEVKTDISISIFSDLKDFKYSIQKEHKVWKSIRGVSQANQWSDPKIKSIHNLNFIVKLTELIFNDPDDKIVYGTVSDFTGKITINARYKEMIIAQGETYFLKKFTARKRVDNGEMTLQLSNIQQEKFNEPIPITKFQFPQEECSLVSVNEILKACSPKK